MLYLLIRFERELEKLRKEINTASSTPNSIGMPSQPSSPLQKATDGASYAGSSDAPSTANSHQTEMNTLVNAGLRPALGLLNSPLALGPTDMSGEAESGDQLDLGAAVTSGLDVGESRKDR